MILCGVSDLLEKRNRPQNQQIDDGVAHRLRNVEEKKDVGPIRLVMGRERRFRTRLLAYQHSVELHDRMGAGDVEGSIQTEE